MKNPETRFEQRVLDTILKEARQWTDDLLKDVFDPAKMMSFIRGMGIDVFGLSGMAGQQPGFDPYIVLGLDRSSTDGEVKKRYCSLLKKLHPDTSGVEGTGFFLRMVIAAYEMIRRERKWQQ